MDSDSKVIDDVLSSPKAKTSERYIRKHYADEYAKIIQYPGEEWSERLYNYIYGCPEHKCETCGTPTKYTSFTKGYKQFCSPKCASIGTRDKSKRTCLKKYGVDNPAKSNGTKQVVHDTIIKRYGSMEAFKQIVQEKRISTLIERYGVDNPSKLSEVVEKISTSNRQTFATGEPHKKMKKTCLEIYGDENYNNRLKAQQTCQDKYGIEYYTNPTQARQTKLERYGDENYNNRTKSKQTKLERYGDENYCNHDQTKQTCLDRYGVECVSKSPTISKKASETNKLVNKTGVPLQKRRETCLKRYGEVNNKIVEAKHNHPDLISSIEGVWTCTCTNLDCTLCSEKTYQTDSSTYNNRQAIGVEQCTKLNPIKALVSQEELSLKHWLDEIGVEYTSESDILRPKKLDIYIPSKKLAIEYNGVYWHSDACKPKRYHMDKYKACEAHGVQLIQIWSDWWLNKPEAVKSVILSKLGIYNNRVGARQCHIKEVGASTASQFENEYHLQGSTPSKYKLGLYYKDELVSLMTFGKARTGMSSKDKKDGEYELIRYCCKSGWQVVGGASKLFKHFIQLVHPITILSFSSNDISNGSLYKNLGFTKIGETVGYWYIDRELNRYHRYTFNKYNIAKRGWAPAEGEWTERSVMDNLGFYRIWDSGQTKWLLQILLESPTN